MRRLVVVALVAACVADPDPDATVDGGPGGDGAATTDGGGDAGPCLAPVTAPPWLEPELTASIAKLAGATDIAPGVRLSDRATATRRSAVRTFLTSALTELGLTATVETYGQGANVVAELPATTGAGTSLVVVGAHFDSVPRSPGADDNATGSAAVLAIAHLLRDTPCRTSRVRLVWFDQEEVGLIGSTYHASRLRQSGAAVTAVHTIDQVGWDGDGDGRFEIEQPTAALFAAYQDAGARLGIGVDETATGNTDHAAFRERGFAAVGVSEEFTSGDTTPHYHAPTDTADTVEIPYVARAVRLVGLVVARQAGAP